MFYVGRTNGFRINAEIHSKSFKTLKEAEDFLDWIENNVDSEGVKRGEYYLDAPEVIMASLAQRGQPS